MSFIKTSIYSSRVVVRIVAAPLVKRSLQPNENYKLKNFTFMVVCKQTDRVAAAKKPIVKIDTSKRFTEAEKIHKIFRSLSCLKKFPQI